MSSTAQSALQDRIAQRVRERGVGGLVWAVAVQGDTHVGAIGWRDPADRTTPMTADTVFRIASISKPVVASLAVQMLGAGAMRLDDPIIGWLPELAEVRVLLDPNGPWDGPTEPLHRAITVRDVLELRTGWGMDFGDMAQPHLQRLWELGIGPGPAAPECSPDEFVRALAGVPLAEQPGQRWRYHVSSDLLGVLLERVSGEPLDVLLRRRLLAPLGMTDTAFWLEGEPLARLGQAMTVDDGGAAVLYDPPAGRWSRRPTMFSGGAGLVSTAADLLAFGRMIAAGGTAHGRPVIDADLVAAMTTDRLTSEQRMEAGLDDMGWGWGIGVRAQDAAAGWPSVGCVGWDGGLGSRLLVDPVRDVVLVVLATDGFGSPGMPELLDDVSDEVAALLIEPELSSNP